MFIGRGLHDDTSGQLPAWILPFLKGMVYLGIGTSFGYNTGYAVNPARDFSPRLFSLILSLVSSREWGRKKIDSIIESERLYYGIWGPILATHIGAILGSFFYDLLIGWQIEEDQDESGDSGEESSQSRQQGSSEAQQNVP